MVVVTSEPLGCVSVLTSVFLAVCVGMTSLASLLSGATAGKRLDSICDCSLSTDDDTGTDLFGFFGTTGWREAKRFAFLASFLESVLFKCTYIRLLQIYSLHSEDVL